MSTVGCNAPTPPHSPHPQETSPVCSERSACLAVLSNRTQLGGHFLPVTSPHGTDRRHTAQKKHIGLDSSDGSDPINGRQAGRNTFSHGLHCTLGNGPCAQSGPCQCDLAAGPSSRPKHTRSNGCHTAVRAESSMLTDGAIATTTGSLRLTRSQDLNRQISGVAAY
ncbi:hypothetical protein EYF80_010850 [Liparis tanakae]|uniref:Uncharacterized protein n=1 Tax=Liparis tanakae TaxID=230148 RepID=A0A4Z2IN68_9TELE|nr:hypothetical protein EYF80_010850 [Liparis tanakae]